MFSGMHPDPDPDIIAPVMGHVASLQPHKLVGCDVELPPTVTPSDSLLRSTESTYKSALTLDFTMTSRHIADSWHIITAAVATACVLVALGAKACGDRQPTKVPVSAIRKKVRHQNPVPFPLP